MTTLADKVSTKFKEAFNVVKKLKVAAETSYNKSLYDTSQPRCCKTYNKYLTHGCIAVSGSSPYRPRYLDDTFVNEMKSILSDHPFVKWQYFGSKQGVLTIYPAFHITSGCSGYDPRYRPWYVETATSEPMDVVLVIDTSISMKGSSFNYAKGAALTVLNTTSPRDRVSVD